MFDFPATRHSVLDRLKGGDINSRRHAFGDLVDGYWKPLYKYFRAHWRTSADEAEDLTQAFFSDAYQKEWLAQYDPSQRGFERSCVCARSVCLEGAPARVACERRM